MRLMKNSEIEWIGYIPNEWKVNSLFQIFTQVKNKNTGLKEKNLLSLSYGKIKRKSIDSIGGLLPENFDGYNIIDADDIVLRLTDLQNDHTSLRVGLSTERGIVTSAYLTIRNRSENNPKYLYYYIHSFDIAKGFYGMGAGVRQGLNWDGVKWLKFTIPTVTEQNKIVSFLDEKCAEIDTVIEKTKETVEEYKKLKQSVITQAVTKGIRPNRPMKDSGIEWIGEIPVDWETKKLKFVADFIQTKYSSDYGALNYIGLENIVSWNGSFIKTDSEYDREQSLICDCNDILFGKLRPYLAKVHISEKLQCCSGEFSVIRIKENNTRFLWYQLISHGFIFMVDRSTYGTKMPRANSDYIKNMEISIPSIEEQQEIAEYLDKKCSENDELIAKKTSLLSELESYKKSLIYEYVTGKKEV